MTFLRLTFRLSDWIAFVTDTGQLRVTTMARFRQFGQIEVDSLICFLRDLGYDIEHGPHFTGQMLSHEISPVIYDLDIAAQEIQKIPEVAQWLSRHFPPHSAPKESEPKTITYGIRL